MPGAKAKYLAVVCKVNIKFKRLYHFNYIGWTWIYVFVTEETNYSCEITEESRFAEVCN